MKAKDQHKLKALEFLANPDNDFPTRVVLATEVLGLANSQSLYNIFTVDELHDLEREALELRRTKYASALAQVDAAMLTAAKGGDSKAAKLVYQRLEGWSEKKSIDHGVSNEKDLEWRVTYKTPSHQEKE